ncbi:hypothetical protein M231_02355 [Tremella mesenterica]|uniref:Uncharacterized protein n=1 Tax=Tremella mesenterica TaxID=5217 RepID=A0A4Q1BR84_TREME|nr:hypothetical protein M231_02355 [Tremella mesenterica]
MSEQETAGPSRCPSNQARSLEMNVSNLPSDDSPRSFDDFLDSLMLPDTLSELKDGHNLSKTDPIHWETLKQAVLQTSTLPLEDLPHALYTGVPGKKSNDPSSDILTLLNTMENAILNSLQTTAPDSTRTNVGDAPAQEFHFDQHSLASSVGPDRNHFKKNKRRGGDILPKRTSLVIGPADGAKSQASTEVSQEWRKPGGKKSKPFRPKGCDAWNIVTGNDTEPGRVGVGPAAERAGSVPPTTPVKGQVIGRRITGEEFEGMGQVASEGE